MLTPEMIELVHKRIPYTPFSEYSKKFEEFLTLERTENGIVTMKMHGPGDPNASAKWVHGLHNAIGQALVAIGQDKENNVLIITGSGDTWLGGLDPEYIQFMAASSQEDPRAYARTTYDDWYYDGYQLLKNLVFDVEIPTIAAVNGPSGVGHSEFALACDITLAAPDANFCENHFVVGLAPGDGQYLALRQVCGAKRANWLAYTGTQLTAQKAEEWGIINEVVPKDKVLDRAMEMAQFIMTKDYYTRRLTHSIMVKPWREVVAKDFHEQFASEGWAGAMNSPERHKEFEHKD